MTQILVPMWVNRNLVPLSDILTLFDNNCWQWKIVEFDGMGHFPSGASWEEFQAMVDSGEAIFDWRGIQEFAQNLTQMTEGVIIARDSSGRIAAEVDAFDSSEYRVDADPNLTNLSHMEQRAAEISTTDKNSD